MPAVITARHHGQCLECEEPIIPGQRIARDDADQAWKHAECGVLPAKVECVCEQCFLVHAGECL